jgi:hypothetical protein
MISQLHITNTPPSTATYPMDFTCSQQQPDHTPRPTASDFNGPSSNHTADFNWPTRTNWTSRRPPTTSPPRHSQTASRAPSPTQHTRRSSTHQQQNDEQ